MRNRLLLAAAGVGALALGGAASAATVVSGSFTLDQNQFGTQLGVHGDGAQGVPAATVNGHVNQENSAVTFTSQDMLSWQGGGEAIINGEPLFDDLLITFAHGWGAVTFNLEGPTGQEDPSFDLSNFTLNVNGGAVEFTSGNCTFCLVDNGENKFTVTGPNITTLEFAFDTPIGDIKQVRVRDLTTPPPIPEPATWAMMILGFGGVGAVLRRRRETALFA